MDRRVRKTQAAIKKAFFELLKSKGMDQVKVSEICERADLNRGTFYLNYLDKYDLLEKVIQDAIEQLILKCKMEAKADTGLLMQTFQIIIENKDDYKVLIQADKQGLFADYLSQHILSAYPVEQPRNQAEAIFIANGIVGILSYYLASESTSEEVLYEIKQIVEKFSLLETAPWSFA